jgi:3'-phosphoadenosine 5'-phosphosulfate sulfotransferase (PAPS reductase)/FAD synthetase
MNAITPIVAPDPFLITGPAAISFSGGRTSAYMLWRIIQAHGGTLPDDVVVCFANTGREMPATLDFVRDCAAAWNVAIAWLEYRWTPGKPYVEVVSHNSASRAGEPFAAFLRARSALPNPVQRSCTSELKIRTIKRYIVGELGWKHWTNVIGLRADEPKRVEKKRGPTKDRWSIIMPLNAAGIDKSMILRFWKSQPFDLMLSGPWEGNCDNCFLKSRASIMWMIRTHPERAEWWAEQEAESRGTKGVSRRFRKDRETYADLIDLVQRTPLLPMDETMHELGEACDDGCGV